MLGSKVLISTATIIPVEAQALFEAYKHGRDHYLKAKQDQSETSKICCAWFDECNTPNQQLIDSVEQASDDGLNPADYHADILSGLMLRPMSDFSEDLRADLDLLFSDAFLMLSSHMLVGKVNPQTVHAEWTANRRQRQMESVLRDALERSDITGTLYSLSLIHI